ncbi:MAG TPA: hypothetical protein VF614_09810, partial [Chthoniobacteraceae bacterium]
MIPNPIRKVLSSIREHRVRALLMGGQACVFYGAAEFSRDTDFAILASPANLARLKGALSDLEAELIAVPSFDPKYLQKGHAIHFRCRHPEAAGLRVDLMTRMRGVDPFPQLWKRRTTLALPDGSECDVLSLRDLVQAKKTQRDKDWPMLRRLLEAHYFEHREKATRAQAEFWLRELRTPELLVDLAKQFPQRAKRLLPSRALLKHALDNHAEALASGLVQEEHAEREIDRAYWKPLKEELEFLRRTRTRENPVLVAAIRDHAVLEFIYNGKMRIVEPQTYGVTDTGKEFLRAAEVGRSGGVVNTPMAKLFEVAKISQLKDTGVRFARALPTHNPDDSAMIEVFATLPKPE